MPELRAGLLWRIDARTPRELAAEWQRAKGRFEERTGGKPSIAHVGDAAWLILESAARLGLLPEVTPESHPVATRLDQTMPDWNIWLTGQEQEAERLSCRQCGAPYPTLPMPRVMDGCPLDGDGEAGE